MSDFTIYTGPIAKAIEARDRRIKELEESVAMKTHRLKVLLDVKNQAVESLQNVKMALANSQADIDDLQMRLEATERSLDWSRERVISLKAILADLLLEKFADEIQEF